MSDAVFVRWQRSRLPSLPSFRSLSRGAIGRARLRPWKIAALLSLVALLLAGASYGLWLRHPIAAVAKAPTLPPEWLDISRPIHIFDLEAPALRGLALTYSARRHSAGDGRDDTMSFGLPDRAAPVLRLRLSRRVVAASGVPPLFAALARHAAESGLSIGRAGLSNLISTRFGAFEIADLTLVDAKAMTVPCSGFRLAIAAPPLTIGGLACARSGMPLTHKDLACLIDRLDLASGGEDRDMVDFFAASERRRDPNCRGAGLAPDALHAAWLDDKPVTHPRTSRRR